MLLDFSKQRIAVIGDVMLDEYIYGDSERLSPEAPVPVVRFKERNYVLGGAGNVAANLASLGCQVYLFGAIADDLGGEIVTSILDTFEICYRFHKTIQPTICKKRIITNGQQVVRLDMEAPFKCSITEQNVFLQNILFPEYDAFIISDYGKGIITSMIAQQIIKNGKTVFVDPKDGDWKKYKGAFLIKPNLFEMRKMTGNPIADENSLDYRRIIDYYGIEFLLLTLAEKGMILYDKERYIKYEALQHNISDVSGAGDTAMATLAAVYACTNDIEDAVYIANKAAGVVVGKPGTCVITEKEL